MRLMEKQIKLIWDFRGAESSQTAKHHEKHLKDFIEINKISQFTTTGVEEISATHATAFWVVPQGEMKKYRDLLKPHRGTYYDK